MNKKAHDWAWSKLDELGVKISTRVQIRSAFRRAFKDEVAYMSRENDGTLRSTLTPIQNMMFNSELEVNLANSIRLIKGDNFNYNDFIHEFKSVLRIINVKSCWAE